MKKRIINLIILLSGTLFIFIIVTGKFNVECLFKKIFHISCPGCGLTRSFRSILNLDFINAFKYNILGIPLFILCIIYTILLIKDIITGKGSANEWIIKIFSKYYIFIICLFVISMIINNINGI